MILYKLLVLLFCAQTESLPWSTCSPVYLGHWYDFQNSCMMALHHPPLIWKNLTSNWSGCHHLHRGSVTLNVANTWKSPGKLILYTLSFTLSRTLNGPSSLGINVLLHLLGNLSFRRCTEPRAAGWILFSSCAYWLELNRSSWLFLFFLGHTDVAFLSLPLFHRHLHLVFDLKILKLNSTDLKD